MQGKKGTLLKERCPMVQHFALDHIIGRSDWTERMRKRIVQISDYRYSVLITGPSGTGKELIARAIHAHGQRQEKPFSPLEDRP